MSFYPSERIALFIDGPNLYAATKNLGFEIDFKRLLDAYGKNGRLIRAHYYSPLPMDQEQSAVRPLIDWLAYNGFFTVTKRAKESSGGDAPRKFKTSMNVEIAVDAMSFSNYCDHVMIFSGDGNLRCLVEALQQKGKRVSVVSTTQTDPHMVADELRRQADFFIDLADLEQRIGRPQRV